DGDVFGGEAVVDVHAELALRQVADVPHGRLDRVARAQVLADRLGLGGRFDDDERPLAARRLPVLRLRSLRLRHGVDRSSLAAATLRFRLLHLFHVTLLSSHASTLRQNRTRAHLYHPAVVCASLTTSRPAAPPSRRPARSPPARWRARRPSPCAPSPETRPRPSRRRSA